MESIEFEDQKLNRLEKYEQSLRELWDTIEQTNCGSPRKRRERNEQRGYLKKWLKISQRSTIIFNKRTSRDQHWDNNQTFERLRNLKPVREVNQGILNKIFSRFLIRNFGGQKAVGQYIQSDKKFNQGSYVWQDPTSKVREKLRQSHIKPEGVWSLDLSCKKCSREKLQVEWKDTTW